MHMNQCLFCKIISGNIPSKKIFEDENFVAFTDIHPKAPVHILIVPKKHIPSVNDIESSDANLIGNLIFCAKNIAKDVGLVDGYKLSFNVGKEGGQEVFHIHLHLMGGWKK